MLRGRRREAGIVEDKVRGYCLRNGDVFTISSDLLIYILSQSNFEHLFLPIRRYRRAVWYKPRTWFREWFDIRFVENNDGGIVEDGIR